MLKFKGNLFKLGEVSDGPPSGCLGHRIIFDPLSLETLIPEFKDKPLFMDPSLLIHNQANSIGLITDSGITDSQVWISGHIFSEKKDHTIPSLNSASEPLGLSVDLISCYVPDTRGLIWLITTFTPVGVTVLQQKKPLGKNPHSS